MSENVLHWKPHWLYEPLVRYVKTRVAHAPVMSGTFFPTQQVIDPDMHHGTRVTHVPWCMPGSITSGFLWSRCRGKHSRHFRRMRNPHFSLSDKRPIERCETVWKCCQALFRVQIGLDENALMILATGRYMMHMWSQKPLRTSTLQVYTLLKIFKGTMMISLRWVHRVNPIIFANVLNQLCRSFYQISVWIKFRKNSRVNPLECGLNEHTCSLKHFEQCIINAVNYEYCVDCRIIIWLVRT